MLINVSRLSYQSFPSFSDNFMYYFKNAGPQQSKDIKYIYVGYEKKSFTL